MRLSPTRLGFAIGSTWGLGIFLITLIAIAQGQDGMVFDLIRIYPGYELTITGAALGFLWGFIDGFFGGYVIAWFYNIFGACGGRTKCCGGERCGDCSACHSCGVSACDSCTVKHASKTKTEKPIKVKKTAIKATTDKPKKKTTAKKKK